MSQYMLSNVHTLIKKQMIGFVFHTKNSWNYSNHTANDGPVTIQFKRLVPIYIFPEIRLLFPKQNYNILPPSSYTHLSVSDLYVQDRSAYAAGKENMWTEPGNT